MAGVIATNKRASQVLDFLNICERRHKRKGLSVKGCKVSQNNKDQQSNKEFHDKRVSSATACHIRHLTDCVTDCIIALL